jgi:Zn-dependent protease with chaperone function
MIRPISFVLFVALISANRNEQTVESVNYLGLVLLLGLVPLVAVIGAWFFAGGKIVALIATWILLLAWFMSIYFFSLPAALHVSTNNQVFLNDVLILFPALFWLSVLWFVTSPITNRISWVSHRLRLDALLLLIPLLIFIGISELAFSFGFQEGTTSLIELVGIIALLGFAPFFIEIILPAKSINNDELCSEIASIGRRASVQKTKVLVWNTHNRIMNALAIGIIFQPKKIVLTDKLLNNLTKRELLAVAAHEFGHHKYWHLPFLIITAIAALVCSSQLFTFMAFDLGGSFVLISQVVIVIFAIIFVSRQFELQADAYSAVDISKSTGSDFVTQDGADALSSALVAIATTQNFNINRSDLLHGSIASRTTNLQNLVGCNITELAINKRIVFLKIGLIVLLVIGCVI